MSVAARLLHALVLLYRWTVSPLLGRRCRFLPSCSEYALVALQRHGAQRGSGLILRRLLRCHPWGGWGYDPVPPRQDSPAAPRATPPTAPPASSPSLSSG